MPDVGGISGDHLKSIVERIERLNDEKRSLCEDIKEVFAEAKGNGFDPAIIRKIIAERRRDQDDLDEETTVLDLYRRALGMKPPKPERAGEPGIPFDSAA